MIRLRPLTKDDVPSIQKWENDFELQKLTLTPLKIYDEFEIESYFVDNQGNNNQKACFGICNDNDALIGYTFLRDIDIINKSAFIGKVIIGDKEYRDGTSVIEAVGILLDYGFCTLNLNRIETACMVEHYFTPFMLPAYGFQKEGVKMQYIFKNDTYHDINLYGLLHIDYMLMKERGDLELPKVIRRCAKLIKKSKETR